MVSGNVQIISNEYYGDISCTIKEIKIGEEKWRYSISGSGNKVMLALLANVVGHYFALPLVEQFKDEYQVIALSVPPLPSFTLSGVGLAAILEEEGVEFCDAIGHSNGGVHIQNLVKYRPELVNKIVFSHSLTSLTREDVDTVNKTEVDLYHKAKVVMKILPASVILNALGGKFAKQIQLEAGDSATIAVRKQIKEDIKLLSKEDVLTIINCMEDFLFKYIFEPEQYIKRADRILLLNSPTDRIVNPKQKESMRQLCPGAKEYVFKTGGHVPMLACPSEYYKVVREFLN